MEETISLRELFETLRKRLSLIIVITLLAGAISGVMSYFFIKPVYQSSSQILVSQAAAGALASIAGVSFDADAKYIETYNVIMKSPYVLDQVIENLKLDTTPEGLSGSVNVAQEGQSQVVTISVQNTDPAQAVRIANEIAKTFQQEISQLMRIDNITILTAAELPENPVPIKPQPVVNIAIAVVVGLMLGVGIAFLLEYLDNTIKSEQDIEKLLELPVLGVVTKMTSEEGTESSSLLERNQHNLEVRILMFKKQQKSNSFNRTLIAQTNPRSPISEQYKTIRTNIEFSSSINGAIRSIVVTSSGPGEGKSTTVANLAVVFAQQGKKVLLIDADMRKPTVHYTFRKENTVGLTNVLSKQVGLMHAASQSDTDNLYVLPSGPIPPNPAELLGSKAMDELLDQAVQFFDLVLFDTPPVLAVADAQILSNKCDGSVLVVRSNATIIEAAQKAKELLVTAQAKLLGVVLNDKNQKDHSYYYYYGNN